MWLWRYIIVLDRHGEIERKSVETCSLRTGAAENGAQLINSSSARLASNRSAAIETTKTEKDGHDS